MPQLISGHIFISYSRRDDEIMRRIAFFLRDQGFKVWVDHEKLIPGTPAWEDSIEKAIKNAYAVIALLSPEAKDSEWVRREIAYADQYNKPVFPAFVRGDDDSAIPIRLITRQFIDFRPDEDQGLNQLSAALTFFIEKKQTLEMKRAPAKQEAPVALSAASPQKIQPAKKWILPTGMALTICAVLFGALWVGYRILSPPTASTPSENIASIPTVPSTEEPSQTLVDTPAPEISISTGLNDKPQEYLEDVQILEADTFDESLDNQWNVSNGALDNGALKMTGTNNYDGVSWKREFRAGEGVVIDFNYSEGAIFELFMDYGQYDTDAYKRFGIYIADNLVAVNERGGGNTDGGGFLGDLTLATDTTYSLFIAILPNAEFMQVIWDPADPSKTLFYREKLDPTWLDTNWTFYLQAGGGTILFDNFKELNFSGAK